MPENITVHLLAFGPRNKTAQPRRVAFDTDACTAADVAAVAAAAAAADTSKLLGIRHGQEGASECRDIKADFNQK